MSLLPPSLYGLARPFLFTLDAEDAHHLTLSNLKRAHALIESGKSRGKIVLEGW